MDMPEQELRILLTRLDERQRAQTETLRQIRREIDSLKGQFWKLLLVAGGAAAGGSGVAKVVLTGGL